jgi:SAM-dependent methyltransferase
MKSFTHRHGGSHGGETPPETRGRLLDRGWRYDLEAWFADTFVLRGALRDLRQRVVALAELGDGQAVLDVGCGTGTLALAAAALVGAAGRVAGIDPGLRQIARARSKARRAGVAVDFRMGVIEALPFSEGSFDVVTSTLMMHHLPEDLKRQGPPRWRAFSSREDAWWSPTSRARWATTTPPRTRALGRPGSKTSPS